MNMAPQPGLGASSDKKPDRQPERLIRPSTVNRDDRFSIDFSRCPRGMTMEWKRKSLMGMVDRRNMVTCERNHWKPVPHKLQPQFLGSFAKSEDEPVEMDGMILMMRPAYLSEEAEEERKSDTDNQLHQQLSSLRMASAKDVGNKFTKVKRTVERVSVPQDVDMG
jgi:hypothetical protein